MSSAPGTPGLMNRIRRAGGAIAPALTDRDVDLLVEGIHQRRRRRTVKRIGLTTGLAALAAVTVVVVVVHRAPPVTTAIDDAARGTAPRVFDLTAPAAPAAPATPLRLADGSVVTRLDPGSALSVIVDSPTRVMLDLRRGRERFEVVPLSPAQRSFEVRAGEVTVTVIGTVFTMERVADRIGVAVERGTVRVEWGNVAQALHAGESGWFPPLAGGPPINRRIDKRVDPRAPRRDLGPAAVETAETLLAAADAARAAGQGEEGAALLARLLREHRDDPRAPLAAFTLGRLLMIELGRPREAAAAFAEVRSLRPDGPFAEDALAREAEAHARAGDREAAAARAQEYLRLYPGGRRAAAARALGGQE